MRLTDPEKFPLSHALNFQKREEATLSLKEQRVSSWLFEKALHSSILFSQAERDLKTTIVDLCTCYA